MPRTKAPKVELITFLPSDPVSRDRLKKSVLEAVEAKLSIRQSQEDLKDIRETEKTTHGISPKFFNSLVAAEFDYQYKANKDRKGLEERLEQMTETDVLFGRSAPITGATENLSDEEE